VGYLLSGTLAGYLSARAVGLLAARFGAAGRPGTEAGFDLE
jgi:hypothetical protein